MLRRAMQSALVSLLCVAVVAPLAAQRPAAAAGTSPDTAGPPVPQSFDWWKAKGIRATTPWGQAVDTAATRLILSWTTMPEYTSPLVNHLTVAAGVTSPSAHFGYPIGKPGILHDVDEIYGYYRALAASTHRVRFDLLGETEEGNRMALVQVGSERNLQRLEAVKAGMAKLADPRVTADSEAQRLIADLPVIYTFYAGLHSAETGPPEMAMELAYRLATSDDPAIRDIRDSVVVFIIPVTEVDGRNRVVQWYRRYNRTNYAPDDEIPGPPYWGHYILHDNNRDGLQMSLRLTQILIDLALEWHYPIGHDLHESVPYLYTSTGTGPYNNAIDPITIGEWQWLSNFEVTALTSFGMPGVWTHGFYDGWYPGYLMWVTNNDLNATGRFYETFGNGVPHTQKRTLGGNATRVEWYRPLPPRKETLWSLRDNTNYMETGVLAALELVARNRTRILHEYWTKTKNSLDKGRTEKPYAWLVPRDQPRRADAAAMLDNLRRRGIEVSQASAAGHFGVVDIAAGDYLVLMDQPLRNYAKTLMERQDFPADAPTPYDDVAWTFPLMFDVVARPIDDPKVQQLAVRPVGDALVRIGAPFTRDRHADWFAILPNASAHEIRAYYALRGVPVYAAEDSFDVGKRTLPAGTWLVAADSTVPDRVRRIAGEIGLEVVGVPASALRDVKRHELDPPRIALIHTWRSTQDDGSVRVAFDRFGVPYAYFGVDRLRAHPDLRADYDVVVMAQQGGASGRAILQGIDPKWGPLAYTSTPAYPALGKPDSAQDITGGMGYEGLAALRDFVEKGGTFIALGTAGTLPVDMGMVRDVSTRTMRGLFVPGSVVRGVVTQSRNPITYGYDARVPLYHHFGPYFAVGSARKADVVVRYAAADSLLMSGLAKNPQELAGEPAIVVAPVGKGTLVLFGFDPLHRFQSQGDFAFVWNAITNWNDLGIGLESGKADGDVAENGGGPGNR